MLKGISETSACLVKRQVEKSLNPQMKRIYDERLRAFSITLNFLSPKAYNFVRDTFDTCLPHPRTVGRWYESIDGKPGFSAESFRILKEKSSITENKYG